jgi:antitoxin component of MazEF toxin-antitoxin module
MITQIKRSGNSLVIRLPPVFVKYMEFNEGDFVDISDITKANGKEKDDR